jgi:adenosine deaminase
MVADIKKFVKEIPKGENHYHIDCISPELTWKFTVRNNLNMPFKSLEETKKFYQYDNLDAFINILLQAIATIRTRDDFRDMVIDCAQDMKAQNIIYREAMFDYTACYGSRGISLDEMMEGFIEGLAVVKETYGVDIRFIANLDRTSSAKENFSFLKELISYREKLPLVAVGLDMQEIGYPAHEQEEIFAYAKANGFYLTAHAGEDEGAESVIDALDSLRLDRIDHGVRAAEDEKLLQRLAREKILLTLCPDSNIKLGVYPSWEDFPILKLLEAGCIVSINSDDPPCFPRNLTGNLTKLAETFGFGKREIGQFILNSFKYNFCGQEHIQTVETWLNNRGVL